MPWLSMLPRGPAARLAETEGLSAGTGEAGGQGLGIHSGNCPLKGGHRLLTESLLLSLTTWLLSNGLFSLASHQSHLFSKSHSSLEYA